MLRKRMRRVVPLVLALVAAIPQAAFAGQWYRCRYTGETRSSCCCTDRGQASDGAAAVSRADCCELRRTDPSTIDALGQQGGEIVVPSVMVAVVPPRLDLGAPHPARTPIARATAPPERGAPVYLLVSSLLL
jgi:hypothetical protein